MATAVLLNTVVNSPHRFVDKGDRFLTSWDEIDNYNDLINHDIASFEVKDVILNPDNLLVGNFIISQLHWNSIQFGGDDIDKVPADRRGVYAFAIRTDSSVLPPHSYILYIGMAGRNSDRPLRERYRDYLSPTKVSTRGRITRVMNWRPVLQFMFAAVDNSVPTEDIEALERQLNTALIPPYSERDMEADVRRKRAAWR